VFSLGPFISHCILHEGNSLVPREFQEFLNLDINDPIFESVLNHFLGEKILRIGFIGPTKTLFGFQTVDDDSMLEGEEICH
jgi:hypothetical protein